MVKKNVLVATVISSITIMGASAAALFAGNYSLLRASGYDIVLNDKSQVVSKDNGYLHQITVKKNKFDMVGWTSGTSSLGNIKQDTYGSYTYPGMVYNRSIINGFESLKAVFSGGNLYYTFSEYLMEDMSFDKLNQLTSNTAVNVPSGMNYFILYTDSTTGVDLEGIYLDYTCVEDGSMIYGKNTPRMGARSVPNISGSVNFDDSFVEYKTRSDSTFNNYSTGKYVVDEQEKNNKSWYRWCGYDLRESPALGTQFEVHTTILGNISQAIDETNYFHYSIWPQFSKNGESQPADGWGWEYAFIGNDNYEPLGAAHTIIGDSHAQYSYEGRFFGRYMDVAPYEFEDPDTGTLDGSAMTLREAYEANTFPSWHVVFTFVNNVVTTYINGYKIETDTQALETFNASEDTANLYRFCLHTVNYSRSLDGVGVPYEAFFTYPRVKTIA